MDNTIKNKARFFALYWGQNIIRIKGNTSKIIVCSTYIRPSLLRVGSYLELKPLSSLSNGDAIRFFDLSKYNKIEIIRHFSGKKCLGVDFRWVDDIINNADGYSYGAIGLSIPEITHKQAMIAISLGYYIGDGTEIDYNWVKLKED